jgi:SAM-dependent methyltransferase
VALSNFDRYQRIAWAYDLLDLPFEYGRYRKIRPLLFRGLSGRILEAGVGTGRNFPFYPPDSEIVGIDLSPAMLARAERRRRAAATTVELRQMDVTELNFADRSFDAAVATFLFCTLPDEFADSWHERARPSGQTRRHHSMPRIYPPKRRLSPRADAPLGAVGLLGLWSRV